MQGSQVCAYCSTRVSLLQSAVQIGASCRGAVLTKVMVTAAAAGAATEAEAGIAARAQVAGGCRMITASSTGAPQPLKALATAAATTTAEEEARAAAAVDATADRVQAAAASGDESLPPDMRGSAAADRRSEAAGMAARDDRPMLPRHRTIAVGAAAGMATGTINKVLQLAHHTVGERTAMTLTDSTATAAGNAAMTGATARAPTPMGASGRGTILASAAS